MSNKFSLRQMQDGDRPFILATWIKGVYHSSDWFEEIPPHIFQNKYQSFIEGLLKDSVVTIACLPDADDVILGYAVHRDDTIHWVFVKKSWRNLGIARALIPNNLKQCSSITPAGKILAKKYNLIFNPFI